MTRSAEPTARVFFALSPPPAAPRALGDLARETARRAHGRPVPAENTHVTLAFIGAWPIARMPMLMDAAHDVAGESMRIVLDDLGTFRRAGVAWIGSSSPPDALVRLQFSLAAALRSGGIAFDDLQPYRPHVTLARHCRGPYPQGATPPVAFDVDRFSLMQSEMRAEGARYRELAEWPLG
jgi:2'-5' RNA ligase